MMKTILVALLLFIICANTAIAGWESGETSVSNLSTEDKKALCGARIDYAEMARVQPLKAPRIRSVAASSFDWRTVSGKDFMTPVKNQGSCGSCWAFAVIGTMEAVINIAEDNADLDIDLSEQHLVSTCSSSGDCGGGYPTGALRYIKGHGVPDEECFSYTARNSACTPCIDWQNESYSIENFIYIDSTIEDYKYALREYGPMVVVLRVPEDWFYYRSGVYHPTWTSDKFGWANHAVVLCGYNDDEEYWIIKNSWGAGWGMAGYAYVRYGDLEQYNYAYAIIDPTIPSPPPRNWTTPIDASASTQSNIYFSPEMAIDDEINTCWFSDRDDQNPSIRFDLGRIMTIDAVRMMIYPLDVPVNVEVQVSSDALKWKTVASHHITDGGKMVEINFNETNARFLKVLQTERPRDDASCMEFDVHVIDKMHKLFKWWNPMDFIEER